MEIVLLLLAMAFLVANHNRSRENRQRIANLEGEIALAMVAVLLQKFILSKRDEAPGPTPEAAV